MVLFRRFYPNLHGVFMPHHRNHLMKQQLTPIFSLSLVVLFSSCDKKSHSVEAIPSNASSNHPSEPSELAKSQESAEKLAPVPKPAPMKNPQSAEMQKEMRDLFNRWNALPSEATGKALLEKQRLLASEALGKLAGKNEVTEFLQFLKNKGATDLYAEIVEHGMIEHFRGKTGEAMRQWVLNVEDYAVKEKLMLQAGMAYDGADLAAYFEMVGKYPNAHNCQCRLITGYCCTMAKTDPLEAMKFYAQMCHPKRITNAGLARVMEFVQPDADFLAVAGAIKEDSAGLSKNTRRSLLSNWAQHKPKEAAQYVLSNTSIVHADQMTAVMVPWAQKAPKEAAAWLAEWDSSAHKDQGCVVLAQIMAPSNSADAFAVASQISNFDLKVKIATAVFNHWVKLDRPAAEKAWIKVFPQK